MKILIIEDDKFFREFYSVKLKEQGFDVESAEDGEEGLQKIAANQPELILLDLIMPVKDGFDVLESLGKQELTTKIPILVFSTLGQEDDVQKALKLGARGYTNKSFYDLDQLLKKIFEITSA
jgi:DNA-binding response OmpR family regulator